MVIENQFIDIFRQQHLEGYDHFTIRNCIVDTFDCMGAFRLNTHLVIENCIITYFNIHSCWFNKGLLLKNCVIKNNVDYQMGGHNDEDIRIEGTVFLDFVHFFDCQFDAMVVLRNNVFEKGTDLLGNKGEGFENTFKKGWILENNSGPVDVSEINRR